MNTLIPFTTAFAIIGSTAIAQTPGYSQFTVDAAHRSAPLDASVWYPAATGGEATHIGSNILFIGRDAVAQAETAPGQHPLIVISHGSGGNMNTLAWLGAGLAESGAIVAMVNHPGSTSGDSIPLESIHLDRRVRDLSALMDSVMAQPGLAEHIDPDRITALGFSMGGGTVMMAGGARFDRDQYADYCGGAVAGQQDCGWLIAGGVDMANLPEGLAQDWHDPRIDQVIAVDPAFTAAFTEESLSEMDLPVMLVNLGDTGPGSGWEAVGVGPDGANLTARMPNAEFNWIEDAWHFSFLAECRFYGPLMVWWEDEDPICTNPWGSDRGAVHQEVITLTAAFTGS